MTTRQHPQMNTQPSRRADQPGAALCRRPVQHGLCRFLHLPDAALLPLARHERRRGRHDRRRALGAGGVSVDPCRRPDGPVRDAPGHAVLRLDRHLSRAGVSAGAVVLAAAAAADRQWRGAVLRVVRVADPDRAARRGRCRLYRPLQLFRADRHRDGAARRRAGLGFRRRLDGLSARRGLGRRC